VQDALYLIVRVEIGRSLLLPGSTSYSVAD
jgi:hypothetical protein